MLTDRAREPIAVLAIGQSNMLGKYGPAGHIISDRVQVWVDRSWRRAVLGEPPFQRDRTNNEAANNLAFVFATKLAEHEQRDVRLVLLASDGKRIEFFLPNTVLRRNEWENNQRSRSFGTSLADEIFGVSGAATTCLHDLGKSHFDIVLIHQGEANFAPVAEYPWVYRDKVKALIQEFHQRKLTAGSTQFILGHINPRYHFAREHRAALLPLSGENVMVAEWEGVEDVGSVANSQDAHATGRGLQTLGQLYFEAYLKGEAASGHTEDRR